ncbi:MAG: DUF3108 domain-containing protein [Azospirillaceae bacterium]|nr:DUF3108 domain-containing protein [Azospirillaceae bacterium]
MKNRFRSRPAVPALSWRRALTVAAIATALSAPATRARATAYDIGFDAYGGGLFLAHGLLQLTLGPLPEGRRYDARLDASGNSIITFFTGFSYQATATGAIARPAVAPEAFWSERTLHARHDVMALRFNGDDVEVAADPPLSPEKAARVPAESRRGSVDPLSVGIAVIAAASSATPCHGTYPIFDGRRRYDLTMTAVGPTVLAPTSRSMASGPALECSVLLHPVAGFQTDQDPGKFFADHVDRRATVWFAALRPGDPVVPVRVQVETNFGTFFVHAVSITTKQ